MKKFFLGVFAIAGLVACVQSEEVNVPNPADNQIALSGYVGSSVRGAEDPSTKVQNLDHFTVWAYVGDSAGEVFNSELVSKSGSEWTYVNTRYWMEGYDYRFFAITPYGNGVGNVEVVNNPMTEAHNPFANGLGQINFTNIEGAEDVLYASYTKPAAEATPDKVTFNFNHILSKVKFTFTNGFNNGKATLKIKDVKMVVPAKGYVTLNPANLLSTPAAERVKYNWELGNKDVDGNVTGADETLILDFGNVDGANNLSYGAVKEVDAERLTIPALATQEYKITFTVEIWNGNTVNVKPIEASLTNYEFVSGTAYNLIATIDKDVLDAKKIEFAAEIIDWYKPTPEDHEIGYYKTADGNTYVVTSNDGLKKIAEEINAGVATNRNIVLSEDIDLNATRAESNWTPIGTSTHPFVGTFDGKGFKVSNLVIDGGSSSNIGFFGVTQNGEIKNLVIENAKVSGRLNVGVVAGTPYTSKYSNITVTGHVEVDGMAYVGAVGGKNAYASWDNIVVNVDETSYVNANSVEDGTAYRTYVGGVIGFCGEGGHTFSNIHSNINVKGSTCDVGGIVGIAHYGNNFVNCVCEGDVEIYNASEEADVQEIGGIAGVWHNENGTKVTFTNCQFTGELKANNGYVINTNKFGKLVCAAYGTGTGVLNIDGKLYTVAAPGETVNGSVVADNTEEGQAALKDNAASGKDVILVSDVITTDSGSNGYGATGINVNGGTLDGNGYTLEVNGATSTWDSAVAISSGTIKNITIAKGFRGIFIKTTKTGEPVILDNVTINGPTYTISCDSASKQGIIATNCTIMGWTSFAGTIGWAKFTNCTFGEGAGYNFSRPYAPTTYVNCNFESGHRMDARAAVTFENCTVAGVALTAENLSTLVTSNIANATVVK